MTRHAIRSDGVALCFLAAAVTLPSVIHGLAIPNRFSIMNTHVRRNPDIRRSFGNSNRKTRNPLTAINSKKNEIQTDEFKEIDIDQVLLEAENALKAAETSLVDSDENTKENGDEDYVVNFKEVILVDNDENKKNIGNDDLVNFEEAIRDSLLSDRIEDKGSVTATEILSSSIGGILLGSLLGSVAAFKLSGLDQSLDVLNPNFSFNPIELVIPIIFSATLGGIAGFTGSLQDDVIGIVVRNVLGLPVKALATAIVNSIQEATRRQLEKTTSDIKAIPSNVANSAKQKAGQKAKEVKLAVEISIEAAIEKAKKVLLVLAVLLSLAVVGMLVMNGELPSITGTSLQQF
uniref:Uncharacterized protein n=1 Tax=Pseudo-nitzschia australis TaxID=44445 RepID=A0A7S4AX81_9STRA|mmetsp:Transcript_41/g.107  ORF Transcript_41/g.107 Transcript_41/m.107 type:complete len:347 (-) Transcript_41:218-1258(-)|eukprot:CAMPEP_0168192200 /NCGR_PEP_ID=MMETSP0139_2-20121125/17919_1 /TAXON_ID=44445 /ORGANISM="Pseudo-nitzschia australis, Strain 10249 10 AB" /LENGTH=346 /DNA_ID=CAMNT_0008115419 /DNA_START=143 /DNA_END=1183 /DNA_ORIENTATION=-